MDSRSTNLETKEPKWIAIETLRLEMTRVHAKKIIYLIY